MITVIILILIVAVEVFIFSAPARIPAIKRRAIASRVWRWAAIVLLGSLPTLIHSFGLLWVSPTIQIIFATVPYGTFESEFSLDNELKNEFTTELRWRTFIFWDTERCFTGHIEVCAAADKWLTQKAERQSYQHQYDRRTLSDMLSGLFQLALFLTPSYLTGYAVYRITRDPRKHKMR